jgi:hypothetical protein
MKLEVGKIYKHFKGMEVKIIALAKHTETLEDMVVYEELSDHNIWVRPKEMFLSKVDKEKYPDVKQDYRFVEKEDD